jgi:hypothetical protein
MFKRYAISISLKSIFLSFIFLGCSNDRNANTEAALEWEDVMDTTAVAPSFFPVSDFILGELKELESANTRIQQTTIKGKDTLTTTVSIQALITELQVLKTSKIDSLSLSNYFTEKKFNDQTIGTVTLSYEKNEDILDSLPWKNWDVHISPETGKVVRIYLVEQLQLWKRRQITWIPGKSCQLVTIDEEPNCEHPRVNQITYQWVKQ